MTKKIFVVFGATGSQGGGVARHLLSLANAPFTVRAVTRNAQSAAAQKLARAGAEIVQADLHDAASLTPALRGAHFVYAITDFHDGATRALDREVRLGVNAANATVAAAGDTLECFLWSSLPDPRTLPVPFFQLENWYAKPTVAEYLRGCEGLRGRWVEVWVSAYYQNYVGLAPYYAPWKESEGVYKMSYPVDPDTKMAFTSVDDIGKLAERIANEPSRFHGKTVALNSQLLSPAEQIDIWKKAVGVEAYFQKISPEEYKNWLMEKQNLPEKFATIMTENMTMYGENPRMFLDGADIHASDVLSDLTTFKQYVDAEDWSAYKN